MPRGLDAAAFWKFKDFFLFSAPPGYKPNKKNLPAAWVNA
jgi:hypothetical protein